MPIGVYNTSVSIQLSAVAAVVGIERFVLGLFAVDLFLAAVDPLLDAIDLVRFSSYPDPVASDLKLVACRLGFPAAYLLTKMSQLLCFVTIDR